MSLDTPEAKAASSLPPQGIALQANEPAAPHDWDRIFLHLGACGFEIDRNAAPRRFAGGLANLNYLLRLESGDWVVLRRPPAGPLPPGAHDMAREHRIISAVGKTNVPVPPTLGECTDEEVCDHCTFE